MHKLTECEQIVMKVIWDAGQDISLIRIMDELIEHYGKEWKRQTVSTFLVHLIQKGFVSSYRLGRVFYYREEIPLDVYKEYVTKEFMKFWYHDSREEMIQTLDQMEHGE